jgi:DNA-binding MurR/RpiR family transcriptional regulator
MNRNLTQKIEELYDDFTPVEKTVANYFLNLKDSSIPSANRIASTLYVSEASISRFAQKCGFHGFREFSFHFKNASGKSRERDLDALSQKVATAYQSLLDKTLSLINEEQLKRVSQMIATSKHVYIYGIGSSGIAAQEFELRLMRIGIFISAVTDSHLLRINSALVDQDCLVIGMSLSGTTKEITSSLKMAKNHQASVVLITASKNQALLDCCDELMRVASTKNLNTGTSISPQFPLLVMLDVLYSYFIQTDYFSRMSIHTETLSALYTGSSKE